MWEDLRVQAPSQAKRSTSRLAAITAVLISALSLPAIPAHACTFGTAGCSAGGTFSYDKYLLDKGMQGDAYALTQWQERQTQKWIGQVSQTPYVPPRPSYSSVSRGAQGQTVIGTDGTAGTGSSAEYEQYFKDLADWQSKYGSGSGAASTATYSAPKQWWDTSGFVIPIDVNTPGISELWPRIFTQSRPYPDGPIIQSKIKEFAIWALPRELYDKGSPRGVIDLAEKLRCANWSIASKDLCAEEADLVLNEMIALSNQLATELVTPAENLSDLDPYIQEALAARGGDARQAQGYVIDESQWDFLVRARVINQLQRRDAALQSLRALEARRGAGAQTHSVARNVRVSLVQNPVASGARLEVSVRSRLKPGGKCRVDTLRWNEGQGVFVTAATTILTVTSRRVCATTLNAQYGDLIRVTSGTGQALAEFRMPA